MNHKRIHYAAQTNHMRELVIERECAKLTGKLKPSPKR